MKEGTFEGTSNNGDLKEALDQAIFTAKETLETDHVNWEIKKISGESGGFVLVDILTVQIHVTV